MKILTTFLLLAVSGLVPTFGAIFVPPRGGSSIVFATNTLGLEGSSGIEIQTNVGTLTIVNKWPTNTLATQPLVTNLVETRLALTGGTMSGPITNANLIGAILVPDYDCTPPLLGTFGYGLTNTAALVLHKETRFRPYLDYASDQWNWLAAGDGKDYQTVLRIGDLNPTQFGASLDQPSNIVSIASGAAVTNVTLFGTNVADVVRLGSFILGGYFESPDQVYSFQVDGVMTSNDVVRAGEVTNIVQGLSAGVSLPVAGGAMSGPLTNWSGIYGNGVGLTNVPTDTTRLAVAGGTMTGGLTNNVRIYGNGVGLTNLPTDTSRLAVAGGTMTGGLTNEAGFVGNGAGLTNLSGRAATFSTITATDGTNFVLDLGGSLYQRIDVTNDVFFVHTTNGPGAVSVKLVSGITNNVFFPTNWVWLSTNGLAVVNGCWHVAVTNRTGVLALSADGSAASNVVAAFLCAP